MKRKLIALLLVFSAVFTCSAEFRWGPTAGINVSSLFWKQKLVETNQTCGFNAGVMGEIMIPGIGFGVDFGLRYSYRGAKVHFGQKEIWASSGYGTENVMFHTIQIPVNLRFKWTRMEGLEHYIAPFAYAGPLFNFNVATNDVPAIEYPTGSVGLQFGLGLELLERYQISAGYLWGLSYDCRTVKLDNFSARTQGWQVNVAVLF